MENKAMVLDLARNDEYQPLLTGQPQTRGMRIPEWNESHQL